MDYRRASLVGLRQQQASSNPHIYASFAGANGSKSPNGFSSDTNNMWWDDDRIEATVTRQFVISKLRQDEAARLDEPMEFGDGLTDDTYWEWIESKAKRIFLILVELGVPDQIFGVIDDSWDDADLPVPLDQVERLQLTYDKDEKLERRFFHRQYNYLLRHIQKGDHVIYEDDEVVPLEQAEKRPVGAVASLTQSNADKVHLPGKPDDMFVRRRIPLGTEGGRMPQEEFLSGIEAMKVIEHDHLTCLWASYIHQGCGYLLLTPVNDSTLKHFLTITPQSVKILAKQDRRVLLLNWIHCLADALAYLHKQGLAHRNIKPSNVMLDVDNHIFLGDTGMLSSYAEKRGFDKENYDYSAPEQGNRPPAPAPILLPVTRPVTTRRATLSTNGSVYSSNYSVYTSSNSNDSVSIYTDSTGSYPSNSPPRNGVGKRHDPQKADVFSMGAIFLEILTFFLKRASRNFSSHRSAKNKTPGRGGGLPDASFHKNLGQVESWTNILAKDASKKEDKLFRGVGQIINLTRQMMNPNPESRPSALQVQERLYIILSENSGLGSTSDGSESRIHCDVLRTKQNEWNFGFDELRLQSQRAAAEACEAVSPTGTEIRSIPLGNGGVIYGIEKKESFGSPPSREGDRMSIVTKGSRSSEGKSKGSGSLTGTAKVKPRAKAWQAPVYAELSFG